jgi:hypothetical protein
LFQNGNNSNKNVRFQALLKGGVPWHAISFKTSITP